MKTYLTTNNNIANSLFNEFFGSSFYNQAPTLMATDVKKDENGLELFIELAGFKKEEINLSFEKGYLTVSAESQLSEEDLKNFVRTERARTLKRSYYVGEINESAITARYENGILIVKLPKKERVESLKKIAIE